MGTVYSLLCLFCMLTVGSGTRIEGRAKEREGIALSPLQLRRRIDERNLQRTSMEETMKIWADVYHNRDILSGEEKNLAYAVDSSDICHLRCCGNNSIPQVVNIRDGGTRGTVECHDIVTDRKIFEYEYTCYGNEHGPGKHSFYPCITNGCEGHGTPDGPCNICDRSDAHNLVYDFGECVEPGDCKEEFATIQDDRTCKCIRLNQGKTCLDPGDVQTPSQIVAESKPGFEGAQTVFTPEQYKLIGMLTDENHFGAADTNSDGYISQKELLIAAAKRRLSPRMDAKLCKTVVQRFGSSLADDSPRSVIGLTISDLRAITDYEMTLTFALQKGGMIADQQTQNALREIGLGLVAGSMVRNPGMEARMRWWQPYMYTRRIDGWQCAGTTVVIRNGWRGRAWGALSSRNGAVYVGLQHHGSSVTQTVSGMTPEGQYRLIASVARRLNYGAGQRLRVEIDGRVEKVITPGDRRFEEIAIPFEASSSKVKIAFINDSPGPRWLDRTVFVDNVRITSEAYVDVGDGLCTNARQKTPPHCEIVLRAPETCEDICSSVSSCDAYAFSEDDGACVVYGPQRDFRGVGRVRSCASQSSRYGVVQASCRGMSSGLCKSYTCHKKNDYGASTANAAFRDKKFSADELVAIMPYRGGSMTLEAAKAFVKAGDEDGDKKLNEFEVIKALDKLVPTVTVGAPFVITHKMYDVLVSLTESDFESPKTFNALSPDMFAARMQQKGLSDFDAEDARPLFERLTGPESTHQMTFDIFHEAFARIQDSVAYVPVGESGDSYVNAGGIDVQTASFGANCDIDLKDNVFDDVRAACNGRESCEFSVDPRVVASVRANCPRVLEGAYICPGAADMDQRSFAAGSGCDAEGGGEGTMCVDAGTLSVALSCKTELDEARENAVSGYENEEPTSSDPGINGGGWTLVRRVKSGLKWHPSTDRLAFTDTYGPETISDWRDSDVTFSRVVDEPFDQVLFARCDLSKWMIVAAQQLGPTDEKKAVVRVVNPSEKMRTYSSVWGKNRIGTGHARSMLDSPQAWSAARNVAGEWMTIDLGKSLAVAGVVEQGRGDAWNAQWVRTFTVSLSADKRRWTNVPGTFSGVQGKRARRQYTFPKPQKARYVRLTAKTWSHHISMRAAVLVADPVPTTGTLTMLLSYNNGRLERTPHDVVWQNAKDKGTIVSISRLNDPNSVLYAERNAVAPRNTLKKTGGACVFVRQHDVERAEQCSSGMFENDGTCQACSTTCPKGAYVNGGCSGRLDTLCTTCDPLCHPDHGCLTGGTRLGTQCLVKCRYVEDGGVCKRECPKGKYNRGGKCVRCSSSCPTNTKVVAQCKQSKDVDSDHDLVCSRCRTCTRFSFDSGAGCNRRPGLVEQDRVCQSCHSECHRAWWWWGGNDCTGGGDNQCTHGCRNVKHNNRCLPQCPRGRYRHYQTCPKCSTCTGWGWYQYRSCTIHRNTICHFSWWKYWHAWWNWWRSHWRWWWSDARVKCDVFRDGVSESGIPIYTFRYLDGVSPYDGRSSCNVSLADLDSSAACVGPTYRGTIAQDLLAMNRTDALAYPCSEAGPIAVDYSKIDVDFSLLSDESL